MRKLDRGTLKTALCDAVREGWAAFRREYPDDPVYGLGLYTSDEAGYIGMTVFSEGGLTEVATEYAEEAGVEIEDKKPCLRWSPCDSPHHLWRPDLFETAQKLLDAGADPVAAFEVFVDALRTLDAEGTFGADRASMVISIWIGDQSDEDRVDYARRLNPEPIAERFEEELEEIAETCFGTRDEDSLWD